MPRRPLQPTPLQPTPLQPTPPQTAPRQTAPLRRPGVPASREAASSGPRVPGRPGPPGPGPPGPLRPLRRGNSSPGRLRHAPREPRGPRTGGSRSSASGHPAPPPAPGRPAPWRGPRSARHVAAGSSSRPGRKASPARRRSKRARLAALAIVVVGVLVIGLATGFGSELSAEPTAQAFLLDWQQQQYGAAGALTTAAPGTVTTALKGAFAQVDATQLLLSMHSIVQHGGTAEASFTASVSLAGRGTPVDLSGPVRPAPGERRPGRLTGRLASSTRAWARASGWRW